MTFIAGLNLTEWFKDSISSTLGFTTATVNAEPVHILNGVLAQSLEGPRAPKLAQALISKKSGSWATSDSILRRTAERSNIPLVLPADPLELGSLRNLLRELLGSDGAVFTAEQSYQVAHPGFVTTDRTGAQMGRLCASLLLHHAHAGPEVMALAERLCSPQPNPYWAVQSALVGELTIDQFSIPEVEPVPWAHDAKTDQFANDLGGLLRRTVQLGSVAADSLDALKVLANAAEFVCVLAYAQVPSLMMYGAHTPLLVAVSQDAQTVRDASARGSLPSVHAAMDTWVASRLQKTVSERLGAEVTDRSTVESFLASTIPYGRGAQQKRSEKSQKVIEKSKEMLAQYLPVGLSGEFDLSEPAALALLDMLRATMAQGYSHWFEHHAKRCGFLAPRRGRTIKRLCVEATLATTLVLAAVEEDEASLPYNEWLTRLHSRYGIIVGPASQARHMSPRASEYDLEENRDALAVLLTRIGLARAYSDNTVEVLNPLQIWKTA
ncbi:hypothetical protein ACEZCY_27935 [Streptacidiphilus sp. N1-12]|uniref:Uncharacterized protein n=2 Tax=Streptacidiphilus alkalitolerans TaxID=3342712 RepID=A0ABV6WLW4_9ACTN